MIILAIVNQSSVVSDAMLAEVVDAIQYQVRRDFAPIWGVDAQLVLVGHAAVAPKGAWQMVILDDSDQAGALGYHDVTAEGLPLGKAFIRSDVLAKRPWSTTISHEVLEILADPDISLSVEYAGTKKTVFFAREVCDPCQDDKWAYTVTVSSPLSPVLVSDFVLPGWYHAWRNYPYYDFARHIKKPLQILEGGYQSIYDPTSGRGWQEVDAKSNPVSAFDARARVGSRRERRHLQRVQWQTSTKE